MNTEKVGVLTAFELNASNKKLAIQKMVNILTEKKYITDADEFTKDVFDREAILPTFIGHGIGLPHSQSLYVLKPVVVIGRLTESITWSENNQVKLIFLIAVPKTSKSNIHLKILANLSRMLMHEDFRQSLLYENENKVREIILQKMTI